MQPKKKNLQYHQLLPKLSTCCFLLHKPISPSIPITISNIWIINFWWYELQFCLQEDFQVLPEACQVFILSLNLTFYGLWSYCIVFHGGLFISECECWKGLFLDSVTFIAHIRGPDIMVYCYWYSITIIAFMDHKNWNMHKKYEFILHYPVVN